MNKVVNLTPHPITLRDSDDTDTTIPPSGQIARLTCEPGRVLLQPCEGLPVPVYGPDTAGDIVGLPGAAPDTLYIVSNVVADAVSDRQDVVCPATGPADNPIRNTGGQVVAVTRLKLGRRPIA